MKKILLIIALLISTLTPVGAQQIGGNFDYVCSYENGSRINRNVTSLGTTSLKITLFEVPGMMSKLIVTGTTVTPWGATNVYALPMAGDNNYSYSGTNNGWYVFTWGSQSLLINNSNTVVRLVPINNRNCYAEFHKR